MHQMLEIDIPQQQQKKNVKRQEQHGPHTTKSAARDTQIYNYIYIYVLRWSMQMCMSVLRPMQNYDHNAIGRPFSKRERKG